MDKYNAAYINTLSEERDYKVLFEWVVRLHKENVDLRSQLEEEDYTYMWDEAKNEWNNGT